MNDTPMFAFTAQHKERQLGRGVSYNGASETAAPSLYYAYIIRGRTIFTATANHLSGRRHQIEPWKWNRN